MLAILDYGRTDLADVPLRQTPFARWLSEAMARRNLGVRQLAQYADVSRSGIAQILSGETRAPQRDTVVKLARYFGEDPNRLQALIDGEGSATPPTSQAEADDLGLDDPMTQIATYLADLERRDEITPEERASIELVARAILERSRRRKEGGQA